MRKETEDIFGQRKVDIIHSAYIVHTLYQQQKLGKYCDLKVLVGDKQYFVHRCILAAASAQLDSQINGLDTIQLVGVTYYGFECLLEILYSGKLKDISLLSDSKFQQIVSAADALNAEIVMEYCTRERGDLMKLLLNQSNTPNVPSQQNEGEVSNSTSSQEAINGDATVNHADTPAGNILQLDKEIKSEQRLYKPDEFGYSETPIAAEVEVDSTQKQDSHRLGIGEISSVATSSQDSAYTNEQASNSRIACVVCGLLCQSTTELNLHMQTHVAEPLFRCDICGLHFKYEPDLIAHNKLHCTCQYCGQEFKTHQDTQAHIQEFHSEQMIMQTQMNVDSRQVAKQSRAPKKRSGVTPSMARSKLGGKPAINPVVVNEIMRGENGKYQCPLCDRGFDRRWNLKCHVLIHTAPDKEKSKASEARYAEAVFTCPECGKMFRNLHNLRRHASSMHNLKAADLQLANDDESTGEYNPISTKKPRKEITEHGTPDGDYQFWCPICGRGFKRNRNLRGHMESHQSHGEAKYECPVCHRKFAQKESLNGHLWVHKSNRGEGDPKTDFSV